MSIHPFQDGNGRLSRLLTTLLLLQNGYEWVEYISFEHEIEKRKKKYYQALWNIIKKLNKKLEISESDLSPKQKNVYICNNSESKTSQISEGTDVPRATLKRVINVLIEKEMIEKNGKGAGTNYKMKSGT